MVGEQISKKLIQGPPRRSHPTWCFMLLPLRNSNGWSSTAGTGANSRPCSSLGVGKLCHRNRESRSCLVGISTLCTGPKSHSFNASQARYLQSKWASWEPAALESSRSHLRSETLWLFSSAEVSHFPHLPVPAASSYSGFHKPQNKVAEASQMQLLLWEKSTLGRCQREANLASVLWDPHIREFALKIYEIKSGKKKRNNNQKTLIQSSSGSTAFIHSV